MRMRRSAIVMLCVLPVLSCAPKPILYPNAHYKEVGEDVADRDIDECRTMAKDAGATPSQGKTGQVAATDFAGPTSVPDFNVTISAQRSGGNVVLTWSTGTLLQAPSVN